MRSVVVFIVFLTAQSVFAQVLVPLAQLDAKTRVSLQRAASASFHFHLDPGVNCTGTFISETGHFLTALHCISACLIKHRAIVKSIATDEPLNLPTGRRGHAYLMTVNDDRVDEGLECAGHLNGKPFTATVVMTGGKGWITPKARVPALAKQAADEYRKLLDDGYEHDFDFAVLKTSRPLNAGCLPLSEQIPAVGDTLRAIPYACVDRQKWKAERKLALFTSGSRTEGFKKSRLYQSRGPAALPIEASWIDRKETFFSNLDLEKCGSGSGLFDDKNHLVGVATRVYKSTTDYEYGSLEAIGSPQIAREIKRKLDVAQAKDAMTCSLTSGLPVPQPAQIPATKGQTHARN